MPIPRSRAGPLAALLLIAAGIVLGIPVHASGQATPALPFTIRGSVVEDETGNPVGGVLVSLLDRTGERHAAGITDARGEFSITYAEPGLYFLSFLHVGFAEHHSGFLAIEYGETIRLDVRLAREAILIEPITVTARRSANRHDATHAGLYLRIPRFPAQVGSNRILVKGDWEMESAFTARDLIERFFPRVARSIKSPAACLYWNGFLVSPLAVDARLDLHVADLEAIEVYGDYLMAPMAMWGPPHTTLQSTCSGVVALWALRPDLPGRTEPRD